MADEDNYAKIYAIAVRVCEQNVLPGHIGKTTLDFVREQIIAETKRELKAVLLQPMVLIAIDSALAVAWIRHQLP